jgi:hypothetical protein
VDAAPSRAPSIQERAADGDMGIFAPREAFGEQNLAGRSNIFRVA